MQNIVLRKGDEIIGVSPAFMISLFSDGFTLDQVREGLRLLHSWGFRAMQLEIYHRDKFSEWNREAIKRINSDVEETGMSVSAFVAHFLLDTFSSGKNLSSDEGLGDWEALLDRLDFFSFAFPVALPLGPFLDRKHVTPELVRLFISKLERFSELAGQHNRILALEILPESIFSLFFHELGYVPAEIAELDVHLLFDTGHHFFADTMTTRILQWFEGRIAALHLCDNSGLENYSDVPGKGNITWSNVMDALAFYGYAGSYDLEIICPSEKVKEYYEQGRRFIRNQLQQRNSYGRVHEERIS